MPPRLFFAICVIIFICQGHEICLDTRFTYFPWYNNFNSGPQDNVNTFCAQFSNWSCCSPSADVFQTVYFINYHAAWHTITGHILRNHWHLMCRFDEELIMLPMRPMEWPFVWNWRRYWVFSWRTCALALSKLLPFLLLGLCPCWCVPFRRRFTFFCLFTSLFSLFAL